MLHMGQRNSQTHTHNTRAYSLGRRRALGGAVRRVLGLQPAAPPKQRYYPQCSTCSYRQAGAVRTGKRTLVTHFAGAQPWHYAGASAGSFACAGGSMRHVLCCLSPTCWPRPRHLRHAPLAGVLVGLRHYVPPSLPGTGRGGGGGSGGGGGAGNSTANDALLMLQLPAPIEALGVWLASHSTAWAHRAKPAFKW